MNPLIRDLEVGKVYDFDLIYGKASDGYLERKTLINKTLQNFSIKPGCSYVDLVIDGCAYKMYRHPRDVEVGKIYEFLGVFGSLYEYTSGLVLSNKKREDVNLSYCITLLTDNGLTHLLCPLDYGSDIFEANI